MPSKIEQRSLVSLQSTIEKNLTVLMSGDAWEVFIDEATFWLALESAEAARAAAEIASVAVDCGLQRMSQGEVLEAVRQFAFHHPPSDLSDVTMSRAWITALIQELWPTATARFAFSLCLGVARDVAINASMGGSCDLLLQTHMQSPYSKPWRNEYRINPGLPVVLSGTITAHRPSEAIGILNAQIKILLGAALALGLARIGVAEREIMSQADAVELSVQGSDKRYEEFLDREVAWLLDHCVFGVFKPNDDLETRKVELGKAQDLADERARFVTRVVHQDACAEVVRACSLLGESIAARDNGLAIALALMAVEAALLELNDSNALLARLTEATAFRLGDSATSRREIRKRVKKLYDLRSRFVHRGEAAGAVEREEAISLARDVLRLEITRALPA